MTFRPLVERGGDPVAASRPAWPGPTLFGVAALVYVLVCLSVLQRPVIWLLGYVADDAFYYLQIVRHLAATGRSTFDGMNPTNGYHPGWMLMMTLAARLFPGKVALLRVCLAASFGFHLATSLTLVPIMRRLTGSNWAWVVAALWLLNPFPFTLALFGVESTFAQWTLAVAVWAYLARLAPHLRAGQGAAPPARALALFGAALALAFYGRTDQIILAGAGLALVGSLTWSGPSLALRLRSSARAQGWVGVAFAAGVLPWYVFSLAACGTVTQDSGAMKMLWHAQDTHGWGLTARAAAALKFVLLTWLAAPFSALLTGEFPATAPAAAARLLLLLLGAGTLGWGYRHSIRRGAVRAAGPPDPGPPDPGAPDPGAPVPSDEDLVRVTLWLGGSTLAAGMVYGALLGDSQFWHLAVPGLTLFLLLMAWATRLARVAPVRARGTVGALAVALAAAALVRHGAGLTAPYPWQRDVYVSEPRFEALVPRGAKIGSFDAGIPAYFSPRMVVNLDGLVNHTAAGYWKAHRLGAYLAEQGIGYVANEPAAVAHARPFAGTPLRLHPLAEVPLTGWTPGGRSLWRVDGVR